MGRYKVYIDKNHHLGLISEDGKHRTPAVYDEIQMKEDDVWYCRVYNNWDYFYPSSGKFSLKSRNGHLSGVRGEQLEDYNRPTSVNDRKVYDSIPEKKTSRFIFTYEKGKFGLKNLEGMTVLEPIYDELDVWEDANVIQVRLGDNHFYFNDRKERILTDEPSCKENGMPYWDGMGYHNVMVREIVDSIADNHTYESNAGLIRIDHKKVKDVANLLETNCERYPIRADAIKTFTDPYSYEFGVSILRIYSDANGVISEDGWQTGIEKLTKLGCFRNSWFYIDKFITNSNTMLSVKGLYWLKCRYDAECDVLGKLCFAYGIDERLSDGEVKWIHVEHYNEHCFPRGYDVTDVMNEGTLEELKLRLESDDWAASGNPYGGCFFGYRNIRFSAKRPWVETERILKYMLELGHHPQELTERAIDSFGIFECTTSEEMTFWEKCLNWALSRSEFPNEVKNGKTCYDNYLEKDINSKPHDVQLRIKNLDNLFRSHRALTSKEKEDSDKERINQIANPFDYAILDIW